MFGNIKSVFILEILFSPINDKIKLELVKYNKSLQQKINISIMNYKLFSGKYIIYKKENKGEEYDSFNDLLLFEGEYLNGKRNGKGKEYDFDGNLIFEGEYLNGKRNGIGKEYYFDGKVLFEGDYITNKKWNGIIYDNSGNELYKLNKGKGFVIELDFFSNITFKGEYLNGKRNGKGKEYHSNGKLKFEGEYLNDKEWIGVGYDSNGNI